MYSWWASFRRPASRYLTRQTGAEFGVMISASHNPPEDNGIKFFSRDGFKLEDDDEARIEELIGDGAGSSVHADDGLPLLAAAGR